MMRVYGEGLGPASVEGEVTIELPSGARFYLRVSRSSVHTLCVLAQEGPGMPVAVLTIQPPKALVPGAG